MEESTKIGSWSDWFSIWSWFPFRYFRNDNDPESDNDLIISEKCSKKYIEAYCESLIDCWFHGQTNTDAESRTDLAKDTKDLTLGLYLRLMDKFLRNIKPSEFKGNETEYLLLLRLLSLKRRKGNETTDDCLERLLKDSKVFVQIYRKKGKIAEQMLHKSYWGTRQQLMAGKVVADHVDLKNGSIDAIFGVILVPYAGRIGPGDTGPMHDMFFDNNGPLAYHAAVHDAYGYLTTDHEVGPGYNYMQVDTLDTKNCMAGQMSGIAFWKNKLVEIRERKEKKHKGY